MAHIIFGSNLFFLFFMMSCFSEKTSKRLCLTKQGLMSVLLLHFQEEMTSALATMRVDYEQIKIKTIKDSTNPLLTKRRKKANDGAPVP